MNDSKVNLRHIYLEKRREMSVEEVKEKSRRIFARFKKDVEVQRIKKLLAYIAVNNEVETRNIINYLLKLRVQVFVPASLNGKYGICRFTAWDNLEPGPFGILQPRCTKYTSLADIDIAVIPGVAYSKNGVRLGYGKGIYDRLLSSSKALKIGLAYDFQIVSDIPREDHDVVMDLVINEKRALRFSTI